MTVAQALRAILKEHERACTLHKPMTTLYHGYGVLLERVEKLWTEIRKARDERSWGELRDGMVEVGAMAVRMLIDLVPDVGVCRYRRLGLALPPEFCVVCVPKGLSDGDIIELVESGTSILNDPWLFPRIPCSLNDAREHVFLTDKPAAE